MGTDAGAPNASRRMDIGNLNGFCRYRSPARLIGGYCMRPAQHVDIMFPICMDHYTAAHVVRTFGKHYRYQRIYGNYPLPLTFHEPSSGWYFEGSVSITRKTTHILCLRRFIWHNYVTFYGCSGPMPCIGQE